MDLNSITSVDNVLNGLVIPVDKPLKWTSFDVVNKIRWEIKHAFKIKKIKVGHAGTLDPLATGLLLVCCGKATKSIDQLVLQNKKYSGIIRIGATTPSYDLETEVDQTFNTNPLNIEQLQNLANTFLGTQMQRPPVYSAKRVDGMKAYTHARNGTPITMKESQIEISEFSISKVNWPDVHFIISCSKGTYIRSIAHDFGRRINSGAHLAELKRDNIGEYSLENAIKMDDLIEYFNKFSSNNGDNKSN